MQGAAGVLIYGPEREEARILIFFRTDYNRRREGESLQNVASQFNYHHISGLEQREDIHLIAKSPANALRAFSGISFNKLNKPE